MSALNEIEDDTSLSSPIDFSAHRIHPSIASMHDSMHDYTMSNRSDQIHMSNPNSVLLNYKPEFILSLNLLFLASDISEVEYEEEYT